MDLALVDGRTHPPRFEDDELELVFALGEAHEAAYLESLRAEGRSVYEVSTAFDPTCRHVAEADTLAAMREGYDVVYQATFFDGHWGGRADFLLRVDKPSDLGPWSYEIADTKLSRHLQVPALLQMAVYARRLGELQGRPPERIWVVTGDGQRHAWRLADVAAYADRARRRLELAVQDRPETEPVPVSQCGQCRWIARCAAQWKDQDDLSLVAFMRADHRAVLKDAGVHTLAELAGCAPEDLPSDIGVASRRRLVAQARQQLDERNTGKPSYTLLEPQTPLGLLRLPAPSPGDLFLDFEGDPYADDGEGREFLAGVADRSGYRTAWAHSSDEERQLTADLVDALLRSWAEDPDMHVYHYGAYEVTALKRLTVRHGVREAELDELLRGECFVDLYSVVRQSVIISKASYSIKKVEAFYWGAVRNENPDAAEALAAAIEYERYLVDGDPARLAAIEAYNRDDVASLVDLQGWLERLREELEAAYGPQPRPTRPDEQASPRTPAEQYEQDLADRLRDAGHDLLAGLVEYHRREARPEWWDYFRLGGLDDEELVEDGTAIGGLSGPNEVGTVDRSRLYEYHFPPQDTKIKVGQYPEDVDGHKSIGQVVELDPGEGRLLVKRQADPVHCRAIGPPQPPSDLVIRKSIEATAEAVLRGETTAADGLLERRTRSAPVPVGTLASDVVVELGLKLQGEVLAVQGPPGSGKTTVGAELIRALLDDRELSVGITATSHAVIGNLLAKVGRAGMQKCAENEHCGSDLITRTNDNQAVADGLSDRSLGLVGGTAWLWSRPELEASVDVLVIDEAGQFSLANAVAVARSAKSIVLLGDPQQLSQPTRALHPPGAGRSVLEHILDGADTIPPDKGVFLETSWRMHPGLAEFVSNLAYEGRLRSGPGRNRQTVDPAVRAMSGSGIGVVYVEHDGMGARSPSEAEEVAALWHHLQGAFYTHFTGDRRPIGPREVLVVAPYNAQVGQIRGLLPRGARVGTVDKFQGQEAPVVIYSMTGSSAEDAPRGLAFLYDLHRLNVAVSRAQALAVVVMNQRLLDAPTREAEHLRRVNAFCELSRSSPVGRADT
jgi:uncharacterized protein